MVAEFGQSLGGCNANTSGYAHPLPNPLFDRQAQFTQSIHSTDIRKALVYVKERLNAMDMAVYY
jgi:hypothetical protein